MKKNNVRKKLKRGESSVGSWLNLSSTSTAQLMSRIGFDWLTVEMEHSPISFEVAAQNFAIIAGSGVVPLLRVPWNSTENIKRGLDTGAWGIVVPMVNSRAEAETVVSAARYAPLGNRTIGGLLHAANFDTSTGDYYKSANEEILVVLMAEHVDAIRNADEIMRVPGIDVVFIGPNDLHNSMGLSPAFESEHSEFLDAVTHILKTAKKYGVAAGIHVADAEAAKRRIAEGFQFVAVASDAGMMLGKAAEVAKSLGLGSGEAWAKY
ncbi:MAG: aldolase/citrate lyase family protein [Opitutaceae bacterium]|nr:aldolase/citrate lyase family protein [Opitutaceae bacterium]